MRIYKSSNNRNYLFKNFKKINIKKRIIFIISILFLFSSTLFIPIGLFRSDSESIKLLGQIIRRAVTKIDLKYGFLADDLFSLGDNLFGISLRYLKANFNYQNKLELNLKMDDYKKIMELRNNAMKDKMLVRSSGDKVKGFLTYKNKDYPIRLRLKGDYTDHLLGDKWSFRVETRKDNAFLGMREFSLHHPRTRSYISEYLFHRLLKYEGLPFLRYKFIPISLNGKYLGIYGLEEHFGKEFIENSRLREGPILKLSEEDLRNEWNRDFLINNSIKEKSLINRYLNTNQNNAQIRTFNFQKISNNNEKISQFQLAKSLFNEFLAKKKKTSEIFDISMTAKYFAIIDLLQAIGAPSWHDMPFYFNPINSRLTPIGYDAQISYLIKKRKLSIDQNTLNIFDDPVFISNYVSELNRVSKENYVEKFLESINDDLKKEISIINKSFPFVNIKNFKEELLINRVYIEHRLSKLNPFGINSMEISEDDETIELEIFNKTKFPIKIENLTFRSLSYIPDSKTFLKGENSYKRIPNIKLKFTKEKTSFDKVKNTKKNIYEDKNFLKTIILNYKLIGIDKPQSLETKVFQKIASTNEENNLINRSPSFKKFKDIEINNMEKIISINKNIYINEPLILPKGYKLVISPGIEITIAKKGLILVQGPLIIEGENIKPTIIRRIEDGKGISILHSSEPSKISFTKFENLKANKDFSINVSGGLSFYDSPVKISNSEFINFSSEDALNLVRSQFQINNSRFIGNKSDAIDIDFSNGRIENSLFENNGNDSIDISGGEVFLNKLKINFSGDKAISVGEKSKVIANDIKIGEAFIGIASKDLSTIKINNINFKNSNICLAAYEKKKEYGPGHISLNKFDSNCGGKYVLEEGSSIKVKGDNLLPNTESAYKDLYKK